MNTILFDLDGTVLPMDTDMFVKTYFYQIGKMFEDVIESEKILGFIMDSTKEMIMNVDDVRNQEVFMSKFRSLVNDDEMDMYLERFDKFYDTLFHEVKKTTKENEYMRKSIDLLKEKGYTIALATNPVFPMKANHHRINWAGFEPDEFEYISSYENNSYCKPNVQYYSEVLSSLNKNPEECMMVGNDVMEDLVAAKLGIKTYLIEDHIINRHNIDINADYKGSYVDFYDFVKTLEPIK